MSWDTAQTDLRVLLSDGPTDKLRAFKQVFGMQNGYPAGAATAGNNVFKTFEFRRVTDFSASGTGFPLGIMLDGKTLAASAITQDNPSTGYFQLAIYPEDSQKLEATYYLQWFTDAELDGFLTRASNWLGGDGNYSEIALGLKTAALKYAQSEAYQKLALRFAEAVSETYRLKDAPDPKNMEIVKSYQDAAAIAIKDAYKSRDDYYSRKGKSLAPNFGTISGNVKNPTVS